MKRGILFFIVFSSCTFSWANPITREKAMTIAKNYLKKESPIELRAVEISQAHRAGGLSKDNEFYIFNIAEQDGFIIVSGDDATAPILGHCDHGEYDADNIPANMQWWLDYYKESIQQIRQDSPTPITGKAPKARPTDVVQPLIQTQWDQDYPYNLLCPTMQGSRCPTGCLATALAQVMYFHKHPQDACEALPAYQTSNNVNMPALDSTTFNWDKMKHHYGYDDSEESRNAVAELMLYCGQILRMGYNPGGSGSNPDRLPNDLPHYFHYPNTIHLVSRGGYSIRQWDELLLNELKNNRPVLYCGYTTAYEGHAFVCDGYNGKGMYHINWGWSGRGDGDYRISVLDANVSGTGGSNTSSRFSVSQSILVGVQAEGEDCFEPMSPSVCAYSRPSLMNREFSRESVSDDFSDISIGSYFLWRSERGGWGSNKTIGFALFDEEEVMVDILWQDNKYFWNDYPSYHVAEGLKFGKDVEQGHYTIKMVVNEDNKWTKAFNADLNYVSVMIDTNYMALTPVPKANFNVTNIDKIGKNLVFTLENPADEYNGYLFVLKNDENDKLNAIAYEQVSIEEGSTRELSVYLGDEKLDINNDVFALSVDDNVQDFFYINVNSKNSKLTPTTSIINCNGETNNIVGDRVSCEATFNNEGEGLYHHFVQISLVDENGHIFSTYKKIVDVPSNMSESFVAEFPLTNYESTYRLKTTYYGGEGEKIDILSEPFNVVKGAYYWNTKGEVCTLEPSTTFTVPEDALAISLRGAYTNDVVPNSNPNTIYLLEKSVPKGLKGKNILNSENKSGTLNLTDGYGFYIPYDITITGNVIYRRTMATDEAGQWTTLFLPFSPTSISAGGQAISFSTENEEQGKDMWLMRLDRIEGNNIYFEPETEFQSYYPYLWAVKEAYKEQTIEFKATKTMIQKHFERPVKEKDWSFTYHNALGEGVGYYIIEGNTFVFNNGTTAILPFRAALNCTAGSETPILYINGADPTDGITVSGHNATSKQEAIYNLAGQRITGSKNSLPKGIYIMGGKKVIIK